jgi:hypothetical protein
LGSRIHPPKYPSVSEKAHRGDQSSPRRLPRRRPTPIGAGDALQAIWAKNSFQVSELILGGGMFGQAIGYGTPPEEAESILRLRGSGSRWEFHRYIRRIPAR